MLHTKIFANSLASIFVCLSWLKEDKNSRKILLFHTEILFHPQKCYCYLQKFYSYLQKFYFTRKNVIAICRNFVVTSRNFIAICRNFKAICRNFIAICRNFKAICRNFIAICRNFKAICRNFIAICRNFIAICWNFIVTSRNFIDSYIRKFQGDIMFYIAYVIAYMQLHYYSNMWKYVALVCEGIFRCE